jgi:hypothetical protein
VSLSGSGRSHRGVNPLPSPPLLEAPPRPPAAPARRAEFGFEWGCVGFIVSEYAGDDTTAAPRGRDDAEDNWDLRLCPPVAAPPVDDRRSC